MFASELDKMHPPTELVIQGQVRTSRLTGEIHGLGIRETVVRCRHDAGGDETALRRDSVGSTKDLRRDEERKLSRGKLKLKNETQYEPAGVLSKSLAKVLLARGSFEYLPSLPV